MLISIVLTNWHSCRTYWITQENNQAYLYVREVQFRSDAQKKDVATKVGAVIMNAGQRPARVTRQFYTFVSLPSSSPPPSVAESSTLPNDDVIDRTNPLVFELSIPSQLVAPGVQTVSDLCQDLNSKGWRLYFVGLLKYSDGMDEYPLAICKWLDSAGIWRTCQK